MQGINRRSAVAMCSAAFLASLTGGCVTVENSLRKEDVASFKLTSVAVRYKPDAAISWDDAVRAYGTAKGIPDQELAEASNSPEAKAHARTYLAGRIKTALERNLSPKIAGTRPVRLEIVVGSFTIASAVQRIVIGGSHVMIADAVLVDARTGAQLVSYPNLGVVVAAGQGIVGTAVQAAVDAAQELGPADRVLNTYSERYSAWLLRA